MVSLKGRKKRPLCTLQNGSLNSLRVGLLLLIAVYLLSLHGAAIKTLADLSGRKAGMFEPSYLSIRAESNDSSPSSTMKMISRRAQEEKDGRDEKTAVDDENKEDGQVPNANSKKRTPPVMVPSKQDQEADPEKKEERQQSRDLAPQVSPNQFNAKSAGRKLRIAMVTFSHLKTPGRFETLLFPSLETWLVRGTYFVVLTEQWRDAYRDLCATKPDYCARIEPIFVDCPEGSFGESPCCKQEKGLLRLNADEWDWIVFFDDDMYFDMGGFERYLGRFEPNTTMLATTAGRSAKKLGMYGYLGRRSPYKCSDEEAFKYPWGQPVAYSRAALTLIQPGFRAGALVKQCLEFNVTHDAGNPIVHWMYQIPDVTMKFQMFPAEKINSEIMAVHGIQRYVDKLNKTFTMHDVHQRMQEREHLQIKRFMTQVHNERTGYLQTETYAKYGHPWTWKENEWHTLPKSDCIDPEQRRQQQQRRESK